MMKLNQQQEKEIMQVYNAYCDNYIKGDVQATHALLDDDYTQIGSAEGEVFLNKKDAVQFIYDTIDQVAGKLEMQNRNIRLDQQESLVLIHEHCDLYALADDHWIFYSKFRASTLMHETDDGWKITHQHSSFPDARAQEGENIAIEKIAAENIQLREAVKRRTIQLEHKNRELEIEAALEKVRSRTMGMHNSNELAETASVLFRQIKELGFETWSCGFCIWTKNDLAELWMAADSGGLLPPMMIPYKEETTHRDIYEAFLRGELAHDKVWEGEALAKHYAFLKTIPSVEETIEMLESSGLTLPSRQCYYAGFFKQGYLLLITKEANTGLKDLSERFAQVFDLTYTRFLDLQKAEANAREARIEAALERVRSRTMGMHQSAELEYVIEETTTQLQQLGFHIDSANFSINLDIHKNPDMHLWLGVPGTRGYFRKIVIPYFDHPMFTRTYDAIDKGEELITDTLSREEKNRFYEHIYERIALGEIPQERRNYVLSRDAMTRSTIISTNSALTVIKYTTVPYTNEENAILKRMAHVFDQAYTRFLDLQRAEAQAKEAKIEASLERVRAKAMAMHNSSELDEVLAVMFDQFDVLGIDSVSTHMTLINLENNTFTFRETGKGGHQSYGEQRVPIDSMDIWKEAADKWRTSEPLSLNRLHFPKEMLPQVWQVFHESFASMPEGAKIYPEDYPDGIYHTAGNCKFGYIGMNQTRKATEEEEQIVLKFSTEFGRLYQRFLDLQKAEAQAREAQVEAALERVRSRTLAMQKSNELAETAAVLFKQLINLGIEPNRLYIGVIKNDNGQIEYWVTDEDGSKVSLQFIGETARNTTIKKVYDKWKQGQKSLTIDMQGKELDDYFHYLAEELNVPFKAGLSQKRRQQSLAYFGKGFIGIASPGEQPAETISLLERFAAVFNLTYTRFNDLKIAEAHAQQAELDLLNLKEEKKRTEEALAELQVTQKQLIQSEKMASLGELTVGIAHEIQNPLNFVNNFSEVSNELIREMVEEMNNGDIDEVKAIAKDVQQNLQKILHHGKRADAIVKGMLQHSRSSGGQKEPTNINALTDEYLRLAYHGLRAKDKTFNATLKTAYDKTIGDVNIVPQDIGRVILNLITNAFYTVSEKKKQQADGYEPTVSVSTNKINSSIEISVKDNGNGIPQSLIDKIFQPFFTTKPTGQGTGLGLSLAYDIIKAHGGELQVETKEGIGSEFIIQLPV